MKHTHWRRCCVDSSLLPLLLVVIALLLSTVVVFMVAWLPHIVGVGVLRHNKNLITKS